MKKTYNIAAYCRTSSDSSSTETQKTAVRQYVEKHFPDSDVSFFEDIGVSGKTFENRPVYQELRQHLLNGTYDIFIVKNLSRFSRCVNDGLEEFCTLSCSGVRFISIEEKVDIPGDEK